MNLRQKDLAQYLDLTVSTIIRYEANLLTPSNRVLEKIKVLFKKTKKGI